MFSFTKNCLIGTYLFSSIALMAVDTGSTSASLDAALTSVNAGPDFNLNFNMSVSLVEQVRAVNSDPTFTYAANTITVTGNNNSLDGGTTTRGFFIGGESSSAVGSVTISNLVFNDCSAQGGSTGQTRGGAGMGAGGGLFVGRNTVVILDNCSITNCSAMGGSSGDTGGAITTDTLGGAGMGGNSSTAGSGGGGYGGDADSGGGGSSGFAIGDASGLTPGGNFGGATAPAGAPGIGGSATSPGGAGGFGGGGGASIGFGTDGGIGGFGGGGGGGGVGFGADSADGGFGGGGGTSSSGGGGNGGFGGGGGFGVTFGSPGFGGFGGGNASAATGGAGAGFGGGIFMEPGSDLTILNSITFGGNTTAAGTFGNANTDSIAGFGALGADIFMMSESTLTFDITSGVTLLNPIEGNQGFGDPASDTSLGGLTKRGPALLTLTGNNTYTGTTSVEEGQLRITSSVVTDVVVSAGVVLSGNFDILQDASAMMNGGNLTNSGTVSPGTNGIGTITLDGSYVQNPSGTFLVDITPDGQADRLFMNTNGTATLSGTLEVILGAGNYISGTTYTVINAPTLGTEFDTILKTGPDADFVTLQVDYSSVIITVINNRIFEDQSINSGVPSAVADCFREAVPITPGSDFAMVTELLGILSDSDVNRALTSLSPVRFGALEWINERNNSYVADLLSQHLFELCCSPRDCCSCDCDSSFWITVFGNIMDNTKRLDNLRRFDANAVGALAGMDFCCGPCFYYGASVGYTHTHLIWRNQGGKGNLDSYYGALYASWHCDCFSADVSAIGGGTDQDLERRIVFTGLDRVAKSDPWGYFVTGHLGLRSKWDWCCTTFEPFGVADYNYYTRQSFKERGADSINLNVRSKDQHFIRGEAGLRVYSDTMSNCYCVAPYIGLSWVGEFPLHASKQKATFINQDCVMDVESYDSSVQLASPQGGVKWTCCNGASLTLGYKGLFNNKTRINQVEGRFEWIF